LGLVLRWVIAVTFWRGVAGVAERGSGMGAAGGGGAVGVAEQRELLDAAELG
jgi:hypothetical protein